MWKLHIKLMDGKVIEGNYPWMHAAYTAANNYDELAKKCGLTLIDAITIKELKKDE